MSEAKVSRCNFTLNAEHIKLLNELKDKTGKEKSQIFAEAIGLALARNLPPAQFRWIKEGHSTYKVDLPVADADRARKLWGGKLSPAAVSGILEMARVEGVAIQETRIQEVKDQLRETKRRAADSTSAAKNVKASLRRLLDQLEYFKKGTESDRKRFREIVDPLEVGYITSILKALFEEEAFQRWVLATEFKPRGKEK
jgi:hypothetical protein